MKDWTWRLGWTWGCADAWRLWLRRAKGWDARRRRNWPAKVRKLPFAHAPRFVADVEKRFGRVDICVTNTGGPPSKLFSATTVEDWRLWTDQLLMSTVYFAQETLPRMQKNKWGRFLTITSYSVKQPV